MKKMVPFQGYYGFHDAISNNLSDGNIAEKYCPITATTELGVRGELRSSSSGEGGSNFPKSEAKQASKKHAFAEQKRRERINRHYNTLRQFFPNLPKRLYKMQYNMGKDRQWSSQPTSKTRDKASVLTETVRHVKELQRMVAEQCGSLESTGGAWPFYLPTDNDEANVSSYDGSEGKMLKATVCSEDRPGFNWDLAEAVKSVRGKAVKAEMATIGGRTKAVVVVQWREGGGGEEDVGSLRRALKAVVENRAFGRSRLVTHVLPSSKWARLGQGSINNNELSDGLFVRKI